MLCSKTMDTGQINFSHLMEQDDNLAGDAHDPGEIIWQIKNVSF